MSPVRGDWLLPIAFILGGMTVGGMLVLFLSRGWNAEWVEAAGTWFGAIGTILTLGWAVHIFRAGQQQRLQAEQEALRASAAMVVPKIKLAGGNPHPDGYELDYFPMTIFNDSHTPIWLQRVSFPALLVIQGVPTDERLGPGEEWNGYVKFAPITVSSDEFHHGPIRKFAWTMQFESNGISWRKTSEDIHRVERVSRPEGYAGIRATVEVGA